MRIGPYELREKIGAGGMGTVYRALHPGTGALVAVKVMNESLTSEPILLRRFEQEYTAARQLAHPHLVRSLDFGLEGDRPYLVMEYVDGPSLGARVRGDGPLRPEESVRVALQVAEALQAAHERRLVHRDVKPDNVLLGSDGSAKLADLGLIKDLDAGAMLTRPRQWLGTIGYTAPEQFGEETQVDARADVYALGATLYFALTGVPPFTGRGGLTILQKKLANDFPPPLNLVPTLSPAVNDVICRSLNADPDVRPRSCREFADLLTTGAVQVPAPPPPKRGAANRREAVRHPSSLAILCHIPSNGSDWGAAVQDVSRTGICMQMHCAAEPCDVIRLELDTGTSLQAWVRWVRSAAGGRLRLGCEFERALTPAELEVLLGMQNPTVVVAESGAVARSPLARDDKVTG
jgi:serine/threonine protein kinase